jgi:CHAT domain-containing protein
VPFLALGQVWSQADSIAYFKLADKAETTYYEDVDAAIDQFDSCADLAIKYDRGYEYLYFLSKKAGAAVYHLAFDRAERFLRVQDTIFDHYASILDSAEAYILPRHHTDWLYFLNRIGDQNQIIDRANILIHQINDGFGGVYGPYHQTVAYNYYGVALKNLGRLAEAENAFLDGIQISNELQDIDQRNAFYKQLGDVYRMQGKDDEGIKFYKRAIRENKITYSENPAPGLASRMVSIYSALSKLFAENENLDSAQYYLLHSGPYLERDSFFYPSYLMELADLQIAKGALPEAQKTIQTAIEFVSKSHSERNPVFADIYLRSAKINAKLGKKNEALGLIQKGLRAISVAFEGDAPSDNPTIEQIFDQKRCAEYLFEKAELLKVNDHTASLSAILLAIEIVDQIRANALTDEDRAYLNKQSKKKFDLAISLLAEQATDENAKTALLVMEKMKAINLLGAMRSIDSDEEASMPLALHQKIGHYRSSISEIEDKLRFERDAKVLNELQKSLRIQQQGYIATLDSFRQAQGDQYIARYRISPLIYDHLKKKLEYKKASFIEYYWGKEEVYGLHISADKTTLFTCGKSYELESLMHQASDAVQSPASNLQKTNVFSQLYHQLIAPIEDELSDNLNIVPDEFLFHLPFETLLLSENGQSKYLIEKHQVGYQYSASVMEAIESRVKKSTNQSVLAYAPQFNESGVLASASRAYLTPLFFNQIEVDAISKNFKVEIRRDSLAQLGDFLNLASEYPMIHLATHGQAIDERPSRSFLAFQGATSTTDESKLFLSDLYHLKLNAELVTLSACETGTGAMQTGEGMMSLSRGFHYAGAKSLVTSLWSINDETTAQLMDRFYKNLAKGQSKSQALRNAKIEFINNPALSAASHPFFWAAFVLYGDEHPISFASPGLSWIALIVPVLILGLFFWFFFWRKK